MADKTDNILNQRTTTNLSLLNNQIDFPGTGEAIDILIAEGGESFYNYVDKLGLAKDPDLVVLSSLSHYYYDAEDMNNVNTVINLKELNQIKQINSFLHSICHILPHKSNFIGCFVDNKTINGYVLRNSSCSYHNESSFDAMENGIVSRVPFINKLFSILDSKTNTYMSERSVSILLEDYGFKVMDMTLLDGLTYFHAQKVWINYNNYRA